MINNPKKLFQAMYRILDEIWENTQAEDLRIYVSDADPFLCDDGESADPVVSEDFNTLFEQKKIVECPIMILLFIILKTLTLIMGISKNTLFQYKRMNVK